jgi:hypothetical protein
MSLVASTIGVAPASAVLLTVVVICPSQAATTTALPAQASAVIIRFMFEFPLIPRAGEGSSPRGSSVTRIA